MAYKFEIIGQSLVITDTASAKEAMEYPKSQLYYNKKDLNSSIPIIRIVNLSAEDDLSTFFYCKLSDAVDLNNAPFTESSFKSFARTNLGFKTASGGSGAETDPIFSGSEAALFVAGDKAKLDGMSPITTHGQLSNIGTNTHAQIDTHIANSNNPHAVTKAQVGLGNVVNLNTSTTANITDSTNKRFVSDADLIDLGNLSGVNTNDETTATIQAKRPLKTIEGQSLEGSGNVLITKTLRDVSGTSPIVAAGYQSLIAHPSVTAFNTSTGYGFVSALGAYTAASVTNAINVVSIGTYSLFTTRSIKRDTAIGVAAMYSYVGEEAYTNKRGFSRTESSCNTAVGDNAMFYTRNGKGNLCLGAYAGFGLGRVPNAGCDYNIFIGYRSGFPSTANGIWGDNNVIIGANPPIHGANLGSGNGNGRLIIHSSSEANESDGDSAAILSAVPLVSGNFIDRWFSIGGKIQLNLTYTPSSQGDVAFDRVLTAKSSDGTIGWENRGSITRLNGYSVSTLPAGSQGDTAYVTDATAPSYLGSLVGGGNVVCPVFFNGSSWVSY